MKGLISEFLCGRTVLDIGCGYGKSTKSITKECREISFVVGVDNDCDKLVKALEKLLTKTLAHCSLMDESAVGVNGKETLKLLNSVKDPIERKEVAKLVKRIRSVAGM